MTIPTFYEIPTFLVLLVAIYTLYLLKSVWGDISKGRFKNSYTWIAISLSLFILWGVVHLYLDLWPLVENAELFFHYAVSHMLLLFAVISLAFAIISLRDS